MSATIKDLYSRFIEFYQESFTKRVFVGILLAISIFVYFFIVSIILSPILTSTWGETMLDDLPRIGLIIGLLIAFQIWGVLPQPPKKK
ncbi:hypothetical protein [Candidatus Hodarchaeum mangrovi]